jgi:hypothetical protein
MFHRRSTLHSLAYHHTLPVVARVKVQLTQALGKRSIGGVQFHYSDTTTSVSARA